MGYRILHICPSFNNPLYSEIVERQLEINEWVRVFYFRGKKEGLPNSDKGYVDGAMPFNNLDRFFFLIKERKILKAFKGIYNQNQVDILHAHTLFISGYIAYKLNLEWHIPYVVAVRGTDINLFFKYRINLRNIGIKIMENASKVFYISNIDREKTLNGYIPKEKREAIMEKSIVVNNGISDFWIDRAVPKKTKLRNGELNVIYYGDINENKNIKLTVKALEKMETEGYKVTYTIIGEIIDDNIYKFMCKRKFVKYIPYMPKEELIKYVRDNDLFIMPSFSETFGLSYIEAMSQGLPVIYSKGEGIDGMFDEGAVGYHVEPDSVEDMIKAIENIMQDYDEISGRCIELAKKFRWGDVVENYQDIYNDILEKGNLGTWL